MKVFRRFQSFEGEYFQYRKPSKFISEISIALSTVVGVSSIGVLIVLGIQLQTSDQVADYDGRSYFQITLALFIYTIVILMVCISDIVFALILYAGINQVKLTYCLFWRGATITSLVVTGMLTIAFCTMIRDLIVVLGYIPSLISKPYCLYIVNGFIQELGELKMLPCNSDGTPCHPPGKPTFSLNDLDEIKRSTTVFDMKQARKVGGSYITVTKLKSIPE